MKQNVTKPIKGLHKDNSLSEQPKNTSSFALNAVNETKEGDTTVISNEGSNELCFNLPDGHIPLGSIYIGKNRTVIFSVSKDNTVSEIGLVQNDCEYQTIVNDSSSKEDDKLKFNVANQIDATYRLRRGCDDTIYFTDNLNKPRYFNLNKLEDFKNDDGDWVSRTFDLIKGYNSIPEIVTVEVLDNEGDLPPGSYNVIIQYLDDDFNGTNFLTEVEGINIYHDNLKDKYSDIQGSINLEQEIFKYGKTNKAIRVEYGNLDENYNFYRLAFIHYTSGSGIIDKVVYSSPISTKTTSFIYTGTNGESEGTVEEIQLADVNPAVQKAESIEQIENRLILGNTKGQEVDFCALQKYASKIKADCVVKDTILTNIKEEHNSKNPLVRFNGLSYQPGEVYSFGIMYFFKDMTYSPVYHIPGKSPLVDKSMMYSSGDNIQPMDNTDNFNISEFYTDNSSCNGNDFWGVDCEGNDLLNNNVRHHRFPSRNETGVGFVTKIEKESLKSEYRNIRLLLIGNVKKSKICSENQEGCEEYKAKTFKLIVKYKLDEVDEEFNVIVNPDGNVPLYIDSPIFLSNKKIKDIKLFYIDSDTDKNGTEIVLTKNKSEKQENNLTYEIKVENSTDNNAENIYKVPIFGIKFSSIELPPESVTGKECIGYYIVRQERTRQDKTILDSGVVLPTVNNANFVSSGLISPEFDDSCEQDVFSNNHCYRTSKQNFQLLSPLHKFTDETFDNFTNITEEGYYDIEKTSKSGISYQNVYPGSSADGIDTNESTSDDDGYSLRNIIRATQVQYKLSNKNDKFETDNSDTKIYNLNGASYFVHENEKDSVYNLAMGNKALIISKNNEEDLRTYRPNKRRFPYVYIKSNKDTFYSNFRSNPYYNQTENLQTGPDCTIFKGDIYIAPLRYDNHIFCNAVAGERRESLSFWSGFLAVLTVAVGIITAVFSGGSSLILVGGILGALAGIAMGAASVIEVADFNDIYSNKWFKGLDKTVYDKFYHRTNIDPNVSKFGPLKWRDDTFRWYSDIAGDFWFETPINISLRVQPGTDNSNYLKPLKSFMSDRPDKVSVLKYIGENDDDFDFKDDYYYYRDVSLGAESKEENYFLNKITEIDSENKSGRKYLGTSIPKVYMVNPDHNISKPIKSYYHLPIEYDCCSDCNETFPHRWYWSEQSFQEELTDNYRTFLPNNYKDLDGENGAIKNIFKLNNNLYIHTEEGLWLQPRQHQERVTDQVVSFIGTGEFGSIPAKRIIDDANGLSAGTYHKWSCLKTPHGYFFVCENESKIYQFTGQLKPISDLGLENWFQNNMPVQLDKQYQRSNKKEYPYKDNPSNKFGSGFILTYDTEKERILVTKKDMFFSSQLSDADGYELCITDNNVTLFFDTEKILNERKLDGWIYQEMENCKMKFYKDVLVTKTEKRLVKKFESIPSNADIIIYYDTSGSFTSSVRESIKTNTIAAWEVDFRAANPNWQGQVRNLENPTGSGENWLKCVADTINNYYSGYTDAQLAELDLVVVTFCNEANPVYHDGNINFNNQPKQTYNSNLEEFKILYNKLKSFNGLSYPVLFSGGDSQYTALLLQQLGAFKGRNYTQSEIDSISRNSIITDNNVWNNIVNRLMTTNPYTESLENYGWKGVWNKNNSSGTIVEPTDFAKEINEFLKDINQTIIEEVDVEVSYYDRIYEYEEGEVIAEPVQLINDWTISYSLKREVWVSWHSYLPNFYFHIPEKFYSWKHDVKGVWKHNVLGKYQTFYNKLYPFIVEYVSLSEPLKTKIWDDIMIQTIAKEFLSENNEFVDRRFITFNKAVIYNSRQCTGLLNLKVKDTENDENYLMNQVNDFNPDVITIDRNERDWTLNNIRDIREDYLTSIWKSDLVSLQNEYYIDKILNVSSLNENKDWTQMESFRDKFLVIRLIFDNFENINLSLNYSIESEDVSPR